MKRISFALFLLCCPLFVYGQLDCRDVFKSPIKKASPKKLVSQTKHYSNTGRHWSGYGSEGKSSFKIDFRFLDNLHNKSLVELLEFTIDLKQSTVKLSPQGKQAVRNHVIDHLRREGNTHSFSSAIQIIFELGLRLNDAQMAVVAMKADRLAYTLKSRDLSLFMFVLYKHRGDLPLRELSRFFQAVFVKLRQGEDTKSHEELLLGLSQLVRSRIIRLTSEQLRELDDLSIQQLVSRHFSLLAINKLLRVFYYSHYTPSQALLRSVEDSLLAFMRVDLYLFRSDAKHQVETRLVSYIFVDLLHCYFIPNESLRAFWIEHRSEFAFHATNNEFFNVDNLFRR